MSGTLRRDHAMVALLLDLRQASRYAVGHSWG